MLGAGNVKRRVAIGFVTLNTSADVSLFTYIALESPSSRRNVFHRIDRLEKNGVGESDFRNPQSADDVGPRSVVGLLEGASFIRTKNAFDGARRRLKATPT